MLCSFEGANISQEEVILVGIVWDDDGSSDDRSIYAQHASPYDRKRAAEHFNSQLQRRQRRFGSWLTLLLLVGIGLIVACAVLAYQTVHGWWHQGHVVWNDMGPAVACFALGLACIGLVLSTIQKR